MRFQSFLSLRTAQGRRFWQLIKVIFHIVYSICYEISDDFSRIKPDTFDCLKAECLNSFVSFRKEVNVDDGELIRPPSNFLDSTLCIFS